MTATDPSARTGLLAGWATVDITPRLPVALGGYGDREKPAEQVHDRLEARALALSDGTACAVLVVADVINTDAELVRVVRASVYEALPDVPLLVWVAATHTHSGPALGGLFAPHLRREDVRDALARSLVDAAVQAVDARRPVVARWASGPVEGIAGNRDHPDRPADVDLDLLLLYGSEDERVPLAVAGSFPVHPTVLSAANLEVSADLTGAFRRSFAARAPEDPPWVLLATGAAGDISTRHMRQGQDFAEVERLGGLLADRAWSLVDTARLLIGPADDVRLEWLTQDVQLAPREFPPEEALREQEREFRVAWDAALEAGDIGRARTMETAVQGVKMARVMSRRVAHLRLRSEVGALRIGPLALVSFPGELYNAMGARLRREAGGPLLVVGYANGYLGYLPPAEAYGRPEYEVLVSMLAPGSAERLVTEAERQLRSLFEPDAGAAGRYHQAIVQALDHIDRYQRGAIRLAGSWVARAIARGGMVYTLGTGHSALLAQEVFSRASGLVPVQPIGSGALALHENAVASGEWERLPGAATILLEHSGIGPDDLLIVISNSGRNAVPVEAAEWARGRDIPVIALTSVRHSLSAPSLAPSGNRLLEVCNLVLDNAGRPGDVSVESAAGLQLGATSTVLGAFILQSVVLAAVEEMERIGLEVPVLRSMNVPGAWESNLDLIARYGGRLPPEYEVIRRARQPGDPTAE